MPAPLAVDLRQRLVAAYAAKEGSQRQLAKRFKVSLSFIRDLRRHQRETGTVQPKPHGGGAVAKLGKAQLPIVEALVTAQPDALLEGVEPTYGQKGASTDFTCSSFDHWTAFGLNAPTGTWLKGRFLR